KRRMVAGLTGPDQDGLAAAALIAALRRTIRELEQQQTGIYESDVRPALASTGIELATYESLTEPERTWIDRWHRTNVFPVLTPLSVDPGHRFPFISNLSQNFGVLLSEPGRFEPLFARVKVPSVLPQWVRIPKVREERVAVAGQADDGPAKFVNLPDVIRNNLDDLFPGMQITEVVPFRVTRDSEPEVEQDDDDADDLLELVEEQLRRRRFADTVRL